MDPYCMFLPKIMVNNLHVAYVTEAIQQNKTWSNTLGHIMTGSHFSARSAHNHARIQKVLSEGVQIW